MTQGKPADPAQNRSNPASAPDGKRAAEPARAAGVPAPPSWWRTLRADPPLQSRLALGIGFTALVVLLWWFVTHGAPVERIISPNKLPSPGEVFGSLGSLEPHLLEGITATLQRVLLGVLLATIVGVSLGVFAATNRGVGAAVAPIVIFLRSIPMGAMLPLMLALFTLGERQQVMFIFFAIVAFVFSDTVKAISLVPQRYVETAQTLGATNRQILRKVLVPLALPDIITSLRFQMSLALGYVMLAEAVAAPSGLGAMLNSNERLGNIEQNYALLFVIALLAFALDFLIRFFQRGVFQWRQDL